MKSLNFQPAKTKEDFRKNYQLHDLAEFHGKNLFSQWGVEYKEFGKDRRYEKVWEKGNDKPDIIAQINNIKFLVDWKGKKKKSYWVNKRAINSYKNWGDKLGCKVLVCFFVFNDDNSIKERKFAIVGENSYTELSQKAWDKNDVIAFEETLPIFKRNVLINKITR